MLPISTSGSHRLLAWGGVCLLLTVGCQDVPERPEFNAKACAADAMEQYDQDKDDFLTQEEIEDCPGLLAAFPRVDQDGDEKLSREEIAQRIDYYRTCTTSVISGAVRVLRNGQPVAAATVTLEPEEFLGSEFAPCEGVTDDLGNAYLSREAAQFPGIYLGFYRVRISKIEDGKEVLAEKYNEATEIGFEASNDLPNVSNVPTFHVD